MPKDKIDAWLRDALAADGGLRDALAADGVDAAATTDTTSCMRPTSYELYHAARAHRSFALGELIVVATKTAGAIARRAHERHRQHQKTNATSGALRQLDDGTLRDLGFDRSEIGSIAAELSGEAEYTRVRTLPTHAPKRVPIHAIRS